MFFWNKDPYGQQLEMGLSILMESIRIAGVKLSFQVWWPLVPSRLMRVALCPPLSPLCLCLVSWGRVYPKSLLQAPFRVNQSINQCGPSGGGVWARPRPRRPPPDNGPPADRMLGFCKDSLFGWYLQYCLPLVWVVHAVI